MFVVKREETFKAQRRPAQTRFGSGLNGIEEKEKDASFIR